MFEWALTLTAISFSLILWGVLRTAVWIALAMFATSVLANSVAVMSAIWLSFWVVSSFVIPYRAGCFDARGLSKERRVMILFCSGLLSGVLLYPAQNLVFLLGAFAPMIFIRVFLLFRQPATLIIFCKARWRWILLLLWTFLLALRMFELRWMGA